MLVKFPKVYFFYILIALLSQNLSKGEDKMVFVRAVVALPLGRLESKMPAPGKAKAKSMSGRLYIHTRNNK
jgi:hypothetical protein